DPARVDFDYFKNGLLREVERFADLAGASRVGRSTFGYDRRGLVTSILHRGAADAVVSDYAYAYDGEGWVSRMTLNGRVAAYTYDRTGQLTDVAYSGGQPNESYRYDRNGNRVSASGPAGTFTYAVGAGNRVLSDGVYNYDYDDAGDLIRKTELAT